MPSLDLARIRSEFPALAGGSVFLDNAGGSQVLRRVADRVHEYLLSSSVQLGASYAVSELASQRVLEARRAVALLINAAHDEEVVIGAATTALMFLITQALAASAPATRSSSPTATTRPISAAGCDCSSRAP